MELRKQVIYLTRYARFPLDFVLGLSTEERHAWIAACSEVIDKEVISVEE